jgi:hypothetical protein
LAKRKEEITDKTEAPAAVVSGKASLPEVKPSAKPAKKQKLPPKNKSRLPRKQKKALRQTPSTS